MKFLFSVLDDLSNSGTPEEMVDIDVFNDKLRANNQFIFAWGLHAPKSATVIDNRNGIHTGTGESLIGRLFFIHPPLLMKRMGNLGSAYYHLISCLHRRHLALAGSTPLSPSRCDHIHSE